MAANNVMVERNTDTDVGRVGHILSQISPNTFLVDWHAGNPTEVKIGPHFTPAIFGSARYLQMTDPDGLRKMFRDEPVRVFLMALHELHRPVTSAQLLAKIAGYGIPDEDAQRVWKASQTMFQANANVSKTATKYRWVGTDFDFPEYFASTQASLATATDPHEERSSRRKETTQVPDSPTTVARMRIAAQPLNNDDISAPPSDLITLILSEAENDLLEFRKMSSTPLALSMGLAKLGTAAWKRAEESLDPVSAFRAYPAIASMPSALTIHSTPEFRGWIASDAGVALLVAASSEYKSSSSKERKDFQAPFAALISRATAESSAPDHSIAAWIDVATAVENDQSEFAHGVRLSSIGAITASIRTAGVGKHGMDAHLWKKLAAATVHMPFAKNGGRSSLIGSIFTSDPAVLDSAIWWRGLDFDIAAEVGDGDLGFAFRSSKIVAAILRPIILDNLKRSSSRRALAPLFAAATSVADQIPSADFKAAFERSTTTDPNARAWLEELSGSQKILELETELSTTQDLLSAERHQSEKLRSELTAGVNANAQLQDNLRALGAASEGLRDRERRQIQINSFRALAELAILIENEADRLDPEALVTRTRSVVARQGLRAVGRIGEFIEFDPALQDSPGVRPKIGETVNVVRPGYEWTSDNETLILQKAQVSVTTQSDTNG